VSKQGAVVTFVKYELPMHFMKVKFPTLAPFWECSNAVATNVFLILDAETPEVIRAKKLANI